MTERKKKDPDLVRVIAAVREIKTSRGLIHRGDDIELPPAEAAKLRAEGKLL